MGDSYEVHPSVLDQYHADLMRLYTIRFGHIRTKADNFDLTQYPPIKFVSAPRCRSPLAHGQKKLPTVPPGSAPWISRLPFYRARNGLDLDRVEGVRELNTLRDQRAFIRLETVKDFFLDPKLRYRKCLGFGGMGMALHYRFDNSDKPGNSRDFVIKVGLSIWPNRNLRLEETEQRKHARAAHIVQVLEPEDVNQSPPQRMYTMPRQYDSSDGDSKSSGDEDVEPPPKRPRKRRADYTSEELAEKKVNWYKRPSERKRYQAENRTDKDFLILEFVENGDLRTLLAKCKEQSKTVPNRILWRFWLCLAKMCVAMAFPPRKFHPDRKDHQDELDEVVPHKTHRWRMKRMVHFDLDQLNIFIGGLDASSDHSLVPGLKLGDFGTAAEMKQQKRDSYYLQRRTQAKPFAYAPEQFTEEWDHIPPDRNGSHVCDQPVAGNYGSSMNVWGIALSLITGLQPRRPPVPGYLSMPSGEGGEDVQFITYGAWLLEEERWARVDYNLRFIVATCMCHDPADRPALEDLLATAKDGCLKDEWPDEDDAAIRKWVNDMLFDAPLVEPDLSN